MGEVQMNQPEGGFSSPELAKMFDHMVTGNQTRSVGSSPRLENTVGLLAFAVLWMF